MGVNLKIARGAQSTPIKAMLMLCVLGAGAVAMVIIAALFQLLARLP